MSADNIGTCPSCDKRDAFREYRENYMVDADEEIVHSDESRATAVAVLFDFGGTCDSCDFTINFRHVERFRDPPTMCAVCKKTCEGFVCSDACGMVLTLELGAV